MKQMIPVELAKELITGNTQALSPLRMRLAEAQGLVLAQPLIAPYDIPAYPQSSMDGYALAIESLGQEIMIQGEMAAGSGEKKELQKGTAVRIFTGAAVPAGADTVLVQEKAATENGKLIVLDEKLKKGDNVRPVGSEVSKGDLAMSSGDLLTPAAIGFLAGMGIAEAEVIPRPRVRIIVTGNELQEPGKQLDYGQVFESNSSTLLSALDQLYIRDVKVYRAFDDLHQLKELLSQALEEADLVLMTGGVSVGDYDFTLQAFEACGVDLIFHKIRQKPGKPILFGARAGKPVFGLPGNPASVLTCFYQYVLPAISIQVKKDLRLRTVLATLMTPYQKAAGLTHFLKGLFSGAEARLLTGQESYKLNSFARANCLVVIPEQSVFIDSGDEVEVHLLPDQNH
jgi:molybdopterin molybdotransferase